MLAPSRTRVILMHATGQCSPITHVLGPHQSGLPAPVFRPSPLSTPPSPPYSRRPWLWETFGNVNSVLMTQPDSIPWDKPGVSVDDLLW